MDRTTGKVEVTAHNHGFAVDAPLDAPTETPYGVATVSHVCLNDDVVEGLELRDADGSLKAFSVQYHPEAAAGPHDAAYLFDRFVEPDGRHRLMPKRDDIKSVLVIGSGPIIIGQACEFDYSGTQACRVLMAEGIRVVLVNSNPATIMTDPEFADATYIEPITAEFVEKVIEKERPDALLATLGGQTALNTAMALDAAGVLEKYGVELIGASIEAIDRGENRQIFKKIVEDLGGEVARSAICHSMDDCLAAVEELGYPVVVRPSFTMGGTGSGMAHDETDLRRIAGAGLQASPTTEVLLEESILGWKEYELEVMRDTKDNVVIVCSIENLDPMGVHTGDSITVAPAMTLTDREYQQMRDLSIGIIRVGRRRHRRLQHPVRGQPARRPAGRDRDEPAGLPLERAGVEGDRLPDRQDRGQGRDRLHPRRDPQRHHHPGRRPEHAGGVRADARLRRGEGAAVRLREVPRPPTSSSPPT